MTDAVHLEDGLEGTVTRDPLIGTLLGEYRVLSRLGEGAMGVVYRGEQPVIGKPVAIKVLRTEPGADPVHARRLLDEARAINAARHPNIIDIFSFGEAPTGQPYFVMECLQGEALDIYLREQGGQLPVAEVARFLQQIAAGLSAAHAAGVVHRDLKPSNIFVVRLGDGTRYVKLLDFGVAKRTAPNAGARPTNNVIVGTALYMSPEQVTAGEAGPWTDLYALGCVAYQLLSGAPPFLGPSLVEVLDQHLKMSPVSLRDADSTIPAALDKLVQELLEKLPARRPQSAAIVRKELERIERQLAAAGTQVTGLKVLPKPAFVAPPVAPPVAREKSSRVGWLLLLAPVLGVGAFYGTKRLDALEPPPPVPAPRVAPRPLPAEAPILGIAPAEPVHLPAPEPIRAPPPVLKPPSTSRPTSPYANLERRIADLENRLLSETAAGSEPRVKGVELFNELRAGARRGEPVKELSAKLNAYVRDHTPNH